MNTKSAARQLAEYLAYDGLVRYTADYLESKIQPAIDAAVVTERERCLTALLSQGPHLFAARLTPSTIYGEPPKKPQWFSWPMFWDASPPRPGEL